VVAEARVLCRLVLEVDVGEEWFTRMHSV
jgi:hypothetical protein